MSNFGGDTPLVHSKALWTWNTTDPLAPVVSGFPGANGVSPTKSGLLPADLRNFVGVPLVIRGRPPVPMPDAQIMGFIRWAEDQIEQKTTVLLCQTWIAASPAFSAYDCASIGVVPAGPADYQVRGFDYDLEDAAYDYYQSRSLGEGWTVQQLRYRPVQSANYGGLQPRTAIKNLAFRYPLLNTYFRPSTTWFVEDHDYGLIRLVPSGNLAMLPLFVLQLSALGFGEDLPGGMWFQYTAGLLPYDYKNRYSFMQQLILAYAAVQALAIAQGSVNMGIASIQTSVDGLAQKTEYDKRGAYAGLIDTFKGMRDELMAVAMNQVSGVMISTL